MSYPELLPQLPDQVTVVVSGRALDTARTMADLSPTTKNVGAMVAESLALRFMLAEIVKDGGQLLIRKPSGDIDKLDFPTF